MSKILNRPLFKQIKQEHRGTGITSGLQYRQNYRVGGRVGFKHGGSHVNEGALQKAALSFNPELSFNKGPDLSLSSGINQSNTNLSRSLTLDNLIAQEKARRESVLPATDFSKYNPTAIDAIGGAATKTLEEITTPTAGRTLGKKSEVATFIKNLGKTSAAGKERRQELDLLSKQEARQDTKDIFTAAGDRFDKQSEIELGEKQLETQLASALGSAKINAQARIDVQELINSKLPSELQTYSFLMKSKEDGGLGLGQQEAFSTAFGTRDNQLQFAGTILTAYSGTNSTEPNPVGKTIQVMNLLFPGAFDLSEEDIQKLAAGVGDGSNFD